MVIQRLPLSQIDAPTTEIATEELIHMLVAYMGLEPSRGKKPSGGSRSQSSTGRSQNESPN